MTWQDRLIRRLFDGPTSGEVALTVYAATLDHQETPTHCAERLSASIQGAEGPANKALDCLTFHATTKRRVIDHPVEFLCSWWQCFGVAALQPFIDSLDPELVEAVLRASGYLPGARPRAHLYDAALDLWILRELTPQVGTAAVVH